MAVDALILDASARQSLVTIRSLGRRNLTVAGLDTSRHAAAFASRWCTQGFVSSGGHGTDTYLSDVEQVLDRTGARVLIPAHDGTIALLRRHRARLERRVRIALSNETAMAIAVDKEQTLAIAERLGIAVPLGVSVATADDVPRALKEVGLPAVVKPSESWIGAEGQGTRVVSRLVTTPEEAFRAVSEHTRFGGVTLFQPFIPGRREAMSFLYANGKVYARFAQWAKRTNPPLGGDSVLRQSIAVPADIGDQAERLVREIDLDGYSEVEFRRGRNGGPYLMGINPRLSASVEKAGRAGGAFPVFAYPVGGGEPVV